MSHAWAQAFALVFDPYNILVMLIASVFGLFVGAVPLKIEYSPEVLQSQICRNRQMVRQAVDAGLSTYQEAKEVLVIQQECGDSGLQVRR